MKALEVADRYARSILELAEEKNLVDSLFQELSAVRQAMETRPELLNLLRSPLISRVEKRSLIEGVLGPKTSRVAQDSLNVLVDKNRIELFPFIVDRLHVSINEKKGVQEATVISARELHPSILQLIQKALEESIRKKVFIQTDTDSNLLGGLQIRMGNHMIDGTVRAKLDRLQSQLRTAKV
ncbi:MAG: ATP synthase F1 subunit delta [Candidatus Omnitrophica bacterium]|nr:ATP synthase F1 subunit delta [Candidatus Omnitrophota bacterium]